MAERGLGFVTRLLDAAERNRFTLLSGVGVLVTLVALRVLLIHTLFAGSGLSTVSGAFVCAEFEYIPRFACADGGAPTFLFMDSLYTWGHDLALLLLAFTALIALIHVASDIAPRRLFNAALIGSPLLLLAPVLDRFVFPEIPASYFCYDTAGVLLTTLSIHCYEPVSFARLAAMPATFVTQGAAPWGLRLEALALAVLAAVFVWSRTRSALRAISSAFGAYIVLGIVGSLHLASWAGFLDCTGELNGVGSPTCYSGQLVFMAAFLLLSALILLFLVHRMDRRVLPYAARTPELYFVALPIVGVVVGFLLRGRLLGDSLAVLLLGILVATVSWFAAAALKDAWGPAGRDPPLSGHQRKSLALFALVLSVALAVLLGPAALFLVALLGAVSWSSVYALRLRDDFTKNVPILYLLFFVLVGYLSIDPGAFGAISQLRVDSAFIDIPSSSLGNVWFVTGAILITAIPVAVSVRLDRIPLARHRPTSETAGDLS